MTGNLNFWLNVLLFSLTLYMPILMVLGMHLISLSYHSFQNTMCTLLFDME